MKLLNLYVSLATLMLLLSIGGFLFECSVHADRGALARAVNEAMRVLNTYEPVGSGWIVRPMFIDFDQGDFMGEAHLREDYHIVFLLIDDEAPRADVWDLVAHQWAHALVWTTGDPYDKTTHDDRWERLYGRCRALLQPSFTTSGEIK